MPKKEAPLRQLNDFLPPGTYEAVLQYLHYYKIHLTIARGRKSILGDYRHKTVSRNHRISINGDLNRFSFLITLLHEIAHLLTYEQFSNRAAAHGKEWKSKYGELLKQFLERRIFPADVEQQLLKSLHNPAASSCAEDGLIRVLRKYDTRNGRNRLVEEIPPESLFRLDDGRVFKKGEKQRKRFKCVEISTKKIYLFSPVYEVELVAGT